MAAQFESFIDPITIMFALPLAMTGAIIGLYVAGSELSIMAMIFGMIPLAVATGADTEMRAPMAQVVIGGLITSTILTLFIVAVVYTLLDDLKGFLSN